MRLGRGKSAPSNSRTPLEWIEASNPPSIPSTLHRPYQKYIEYSTHFFQGNNRKFNSTNSDEFLDKTIGMNRPHGSIAINPNYSQKITYNLRTKINQKEKGTGWSKSTSKRFEDVGGHRRANYPPKKSQYLTRKIQSAYAKTKKSMKKEGHASAGDPSARDEYAYATTSEGEYHLPKKMTSSFLSKTRRFDGTFQKRRNQSCRVRKRAEGIDWDLQSEDKKP